MIFKNLFLEGPKGAGKTTLLFKVIKKYPSLKVGGFAVERIFYKGKVRAMEMVDLMTGAKDILLEMGKDEERYVNYACFEKVGIPSLEGGLLKADLLVLDELGRFELRVPSFLKAVSEALDSPKPLVGVLKDESNHFLDSIRCREDVLVQRIEKDTRAKVNLVFQEAFQKILIQDARETP